jgi:hypothetical protein
MTGTRVDFQSTNLEPFGFEPRVVQFFEVRPTTRNVKAQLALCLQTLKDFLGTQNIFDVSVQQPEAYKSKGELNFSSPFA